MPRFDKNGADDIKRAKNDTRDRSVPDDENFYAKTFDFDSFSSSDVRDNQSSFDFDELLPPVRSERQVSDDFDIDFLKSFDSQARQRNSEEVQRGKRSSQKKKKKRHINKKVGVVAVLLAIILVVVGLVNIPLSRINYDDNRGNQYVSADELKSSPFVKNILLLGVDARKGQDSQDSRADSMMLVSIDMKHKCIKMVSFLRDTWVYIPAHNDKQRLNAACKYDGYQGVVDTIEYNFGVDIDGYVVADFEMFKVLVDSVGGVEVEVSKKEAKEVTSHPKRYGNVKLDSGTYKLTGEQALAYCRIRKIDTDFVRTKRQRTVMQSIIKGAKKSGPFTLYNMVLKSAPYIETNLSKAYLKRLAGFAALCLGDMVQARVPFEHTWEYANKGGASVIAINVEKNKDKLLEFIYEKTAEEIKAEQEENK